MKNLAIIGVGLIAGIGAWSLIQAKNASTKINVQPIGVQYKDIVGGVFGSVKMDLKLEVTNSSDLTVRLNYVDLKVMPVGTDKVLANLKIDKSGAQTFDAKHTTNWTIPMSVSVVYLAQLLGISAFDFITKGINSLPQNLDLKGTITANNYNIDIDSSIPISI